MLPYRVLFPLGLVFGVAGVVIWILFFFGAAAYPGPRHAELMMGGFLLSFVCGFLMTAIPRFTGTAAAKRWELVVAVLINLAVLGVGLLGPAGAKLFHSLLLLELLGLAFFALRRVLRHKFTPPDSFIFVGAGLLAGLVGVALWLGQGWLSNSWVLVGRQLYFHGMLLCFVIGVGSRLVPAFLGQKNFAKIQIELHSQKSSRFLSPRLLYSLGALIFLLSFFLEALSRLVVAARTIQAITISIVALGIWRIHRAPRTRSRLAWGLWISAWFIVVGQWAYALSIRHAIDFAHLIFVGGFSLLALMIATRVSLAHGNHSLEPESRSKALWFVIGLVFLATITRVFAGFAPPEAYFQHLAYAAAAWIVAVVIWALLLLPKIFRRTT
jgi:uncharacterized protein involved in response to NO